MRILILSSLLVCCSYAAPAPEIFETAEQVVRSVFSLAQSYEEAPYESKKIDDEVSERSYPSRKWVCTKKTFEEQSDSSQGTMFWKLFNYIQGANSAEKKMPMTVPVTTKVVDSGNGVELEMCFYLNAAEQDSPPTPTNTEVYIVEASRTIYTRTVGGYMNTESWKTEAEKLKTKLEGLSLSFDKDSYWKVGYDAPFKFWNRRNEVWYLKA